MVSASEEVRALCVRVAEAMPPRARTAVVLIAPPRPRGSSGGPTAAAIATSSPSTTAVVRIEWLVREGLVRSSLASGEPTVSTRLAADERWPRFARAVATHDVMSAVAVPIMRDSSVASGALAAYSPDLDGFDPRDLRVLGAFAGVAADLITGEPEETGARGVDEPGTERLVNQAVGVLITRHCDEEQAMRRLRRISESTGQPLAAAAQMIVREAQVEAHLRFVVRSPQQRVQPEPDR